MGTFAEFIAKCGIKIITELFVTKVIMENPNGLYEDVFLDQDKQT